MKRVIKFYNTHNSDGIKFSDCSTEYEILPILVDDTAGIDELLSLLPKLNLSAQCEPVSNEKPQYGWRSLKITNAIQVDTYKSKRYRETESLPVYLGFITLPDENGPLPLQESIGNENITTDTVYEICNNQCYGVQDIGQTVDNETILVKSGWNYFHEIPLLGYSLEKFEQVAGIDEHGFYDDTDRCYNCNLFDSRDDGYNYNFREVDGDWLGVNCGCYHEACKNEFLSFVNDSSKCIEKSVANELVESDQIEFVERFIGGMVDGRGGYYDGESCREGNPESILNDLLKKDSEGEFIFSHDESGQFQTYFSVYKVLNN